MELGDEMRLDKLLSNLKYGTRNEIRKLVKQGYVKVNGEVVTDSGVHVDEIHDEIIIMNEVINYRPYIYLMMNKPQGYISATYDNYHETVLDLLDEEYLRYDLFPCGRLDIDTEGLIILTNDGKFAHQIMHPKKDIYKTYYVEVDQPLSQTDKDIFLRGLTILDGKDEPFTTKPAYLEVLSPYKATISIAEGKFHQVKRMFQALGKQVTYLKRIKIGKLKLDDALELGEYRELTETELALLLENDDK